MNDISSLFVAVSLLVIGGISLFNYKGDDLDDEDVEPKDKTEEKEKEKEEEKEDMDKKRTIKTRRVRKRPAGSRRNKYD
jgi:hypothetical protein